MLAVAAVGSLVGSLFVAGGLKTGRAETFMLFGMSAGMRWWIFVVLPPSTFAWVVLGVLGFASSAAMSTMAVSLLNHAKPAYRGRVMGCVCSPFTGSCGTDAWRILDRGVRGRHHLVLVRRYRPEPVWAMIRWKALTEPRFVRQFD